MEKREQDPILGFVRDPKLQKRAQRSPFLLLPEVGWGGSSRDL